MQFLKIILSFVVLVACIWLLGFAVFTASVLIMQPQKVGQATDVIVVLTGGKNRIETGMQLFSEKLSQQLFITGVHENVTKDEILARWTGAPLPDCCVTIGYKATSTTENADEVREWLDNKNFRTLRLVTSNYHMPRAYLEFHKALPGLTIIPNPIMQPDITTADTYFWIVTFKEYNKTMLRALDIFIKDHR